jgi:biopolymer transport protein ExbB/TolQ
MDTVQAILTVSVPTLAVLVGILINNSRLSDLSKRLDGMERRSDQRFEAMERRSDQRFDDMQRRFDDLERRSDQRFEDLKETWRAELRRVEEVLDARLKHLETQS